MIIELFNLTKKFNTLTAVDGIGLSIEKGEIFGLLGPNGAGKTTTISMLSTLLLPTEGTAKINGYDLRQQDSIRKSIGIVFQDPSLDSELTGKENLDFHGRLYGMPKEKRKQRIAEVLRLVDLEDKANSIVKTYSGGMKRRLEIARGLIHMPQVLFLDEPTLGLDPQTRRKIWEYIRNLNKQHQITVILTTHYMEEADSLCDRIAIIDHGKIIAQGTPPQLKSIIGGDIVTLETDEPQKLKELFEKEKWKKEINVVENAVVISVQDAERVIPKIIEMSHKKKMKIHAVNMKKPTLEDVFIHFTGRTIREERGDGKDAMRQNQRLWGR